MKQYKEFKLLLILFCDLPLFMPVHKACIKKESL